MSSTALLVSIFNLFNESLICVGSGIFGLGSILFQGNARQCIKYTSYMLLGTGTLWTLRNFRQKRTVNENHIVFITGCDSGLGLVFKYIKIIMIFFLYFMLLNMQL